MPPAGPHQPGCETCEVSKTSQVCAVSETLRVRARPGQGETHGARAQGLVEFALILPFLLLLTFGIIEAGRMLAIFSSISSAARQAARYGSVGGDNGTGTPYFLDCAGIRNTAQRNSALLQLANNDISITYQEPTTATGDFSSVGLCGTSSALPTYTAGGSRAMTEDDIDNGYRILITVTTTYRPIVPIVPIPPIPFTFAAGRTIFPAIEGPTPTPRPLPDVVLDLSHAPEPVTVNNSVTYTITVTNNGTADSMPTGRVIVTQTVPSGFGAPSPSSFTLSDSFWRCGYDAATRIITCRRSSLAPGATATVSVRLTASNTPGLYPVTAAMDLGIAGGDANTANNSETETTNVIAVGADLYPTKTDLVDPVFPGDVITYHITVHNIGPVNLGNNDIATVTDAVPPHTTLSSATGFNWTCSSTGTNPGSVVSCTRNPGARALTSGASYAEPIVLRLQTAVGLDTVVSNVASVSITAGTAVDPIPTNNTTDVVTTTVKSEADLSIIKFASATQVGPGNSLIFTLRVTNNGPRDATNVVVTDPVPAPQLDVLSASGSGWSCATAQTVVCTLASLAAGATAPDITISTLVPNPVIPATVTNQATVSSDTTDSNTSNNSATPGFGIQVLNCNPGIPSAAYSTINASPVTVQADGEETAQILVTLRDNCPNFISGASVSVSSSRGGTDTFTTGTTGTTDSNGQVRFFARSSTVGVSTYTAVANPINLTSNSVAFKCVDYQLALFNGARAVQFFFLNQTGIDRRLTSLSINWSPDNASTYLAEIDFPDNTQPSYVLWQSATDNAPVLTVSGTGPNQWLSTGNRVLTAGNGKFLSFIYSLNIPSGATFSLSNVQWDDGSGSSICTTSANMTISKP